jgi:hypothetical protein
VDAYLRHCGSIGILVSIIGDKISNRGYSTASAGKSLDELYFHEIRIKNVFNSPKFQR